MPCPYRGQRRDRERGNEVSYDPERHHRRSIRIPGFDYAAPGWYFVTVCGLDREPLFGRVRDGKADLSAFGHLVEVCWQEIPIHFPRVSLDDFVVMPNHLHGIVVIGHEDGTACRAPTSEAFAAPVPESLATIVRSFKSAATKAINDVRGTRGSPVWQRDYHERVIRDQRELAIKRRYIAQNPVNWAQDDENPEGPRS
jgi:putative transposase